jgi:hypothetical protein
MNETMVRRWFNQKEVFNITFKSTMVNRTMNLPRLVGWNLTQITQRKLSFKLNFTNPIYVCFDEYDKLDIQVLNSVYFVREADDQRLENNYTIHDIRVTGQVASQEDFIRLTRMGTTASSSLLLSLVLPLGISVFRSTSLERVWSFYNMVQIQGSLLWVLPIVYPVMADYILQL